MNCTVKYRKRVIDIFSEVVFSALNFLRLYKKMGGNFSIRVFIESFVEPFLGWQEYYHIFGKGLWDTRVHGTEAYNLAVVNGEMSVEELFNPKYCARADERDQIF